MTWKDVNSNLLKRSGSGLKSLVTDSHAEILIINSGNDVGVVRNGGRRGTCHGPKVLSSNLLKLAKRDFTKKINVITSCDHLTSTINFTDFQNSQSSFIQELLNKQRSSVIHFGGGHDHVYPLVDAIIKEKGAVTVINLDAHLDTRNDDLRHSGTPFRQLKEEHKDDIDIIQIGIHDYANACGNYDGLDMTIQTVNEIKKLTKNFTDNKDYIESIFSNISSDRTIVLSLDMDAIDGSEMPAVSAVNHDGLPMSFIRDVFMSYKCNVKQTSYIGIYEYNPLYDNMGCSSARAMASTLYNYLVD